MLLSKKEITSTSTSVFEYLTGAETLFDRGFLQAEVRHVLLVYLDLVSPYLASVVICLVIISEWPPSLSQRLLWRELSDWSVNWPSVSRRNYLYSNGFF